MMKSLFFTSIGACAVVIVLANSNSCAQEYREGAIIEISKRAELRSGSKVVGHVEPGEAFVIEKVQQGWLLVEKNGTRGYVYKTNVRFADVVPGPVFDEGPFPIGDDEIFRPGMHGPGFGPPMDRTPGKWELGAVETVQTDQFRDRYGVGRGPAGSKIIGGSTDGPHSRGGSTSCQVELPEDAKLLKVRISIWHGNEMEHGKGIHSPKNGSTVKVHLNDKLAHTITCRHRVPGMPDFWPDERAELGSHLPEIDLNGLGITGKQLTVRFDVSPWTCMDLRSINITADLAASFAGGQAIVRGAADFRQKQGKVHFEDDLSFLIVGGGKESVDPRGGTIACSVKLPEGVTFARLLIEHGTRDQFGHGIHSTREGGTLKVNVNGKTVHTFTCNRKVRNLPDWWPEDTGELTHEVPIDLQKFQIDSDTLAIEFEASPGTVMNVRALRVVPGLGTPGDGLPGREAPMRFPLREFRGTEDFPPVFAPGG